MLMRKTIVISAVNLIQAGTLAILRDCLSFLSKYAEEQNIEVIAIVYDKSLVPFDNIRYIENKWPKKRWINRLWFEYVTLNKISKELGPVDLWFSLHDTTPTVKAARRAVYCHNSFSFYKWKLNDLIFAPKIALFAIFTRFIYRPNITKNNYLVVQQNWFRDGLSKMFAINPRKIIVFPPNIEHTKSSSLEKTALTKPYKFIFAASPNSHKNFEVICKAVEILKRKKIDGFQVTITLKGTENSYAEWLYKQWGDIPEIDFKGFVSSQILNDLYEQSHCLIYPSKIESWGLPISEFKNFNRPILLADLPYAHETASGALKTYYFSPDDPADLASAMGKLISNDESFLVPSPQICYEDPKASNWRELFDILLS